jgi:hypothetical protein
MITIATKNLITGRITIILEPFVKLGSVVKESTFSSKLSSIVIDMVEGQEKRFSFSTTSAPVSSISVNCCVLKPVVIGKGVFSTLLGVILSPFCSNIRLMCGMILTVSSVVFLEHFLGIFAPFTPVFKDTFCALPSMPFLLVFGLATLGTNLNHGITSFIVKTIYDYKNNVKGKVQRLFRKEVGSSDPKRIAARTADDIVCSAWKLAAVL